MSLVLQAPTTLYHFPQRYTWNSLQFSYNLYVQSDVQDIYNRMTCFPVSLLKHTFDIRCLCGGEYII